MTLYSAQVTGEKKFLYFWGDRLTWDKLIVKNCKAFKNVYVCDPYANRYRYPKEVKLITSKQTAKRFANIRLEKSAVFINGNTTDVNKFLSNNWIGCDVIVVNVDIKTISYGLRKDVKVLEHSSRRNIKYISKYK